MPGQAGTLATGAGNWHWPGGALGVGRLAWPLQRARLGGTVAPRDAAAAHLVERARSLLVAMLMK